MTILQAADHPTCDCLCVLPSQTLCIITTVCIGREDSAQLPLGDAMVCGKVINCVPRGNNGSRLTSDKGREKTTHPGKDCVPRQRGSFRHHLRYHADLQCELCSWGEWKWHLQVPGACDFLSARGMNFSDHKTITSVIGSSQVLLALLFTIVTTTIPTPVWSWDTALRFFFLNG